MITTFIVTASVALVVGFGAMWLLKPGLRRRIEAPKHLFANQVRQYDIQHRVLNPAAGEQANDDA